MTWPNSLKLIYFGYNFNQKIENVTWPNLLESITFGSNFNQEIEKIEWPDSLQSITFINYRFNQKIENIKWPSSLKYLTLGNNFNQKIENIKWPDLLHSITFGNKFDQPLDFMPESLTTIHIRNPLYEHTLCNLPSSIKKIILHKKLVNKDIIPSELQNKVTYVY